MKKIFLLINFSIEFVLKIIFIIFNMVVLNLVKLEIFNKTYIFIEVILTTKQVELIEKKEFKTPIFKPKEKNYAIYMSNFATTHLYIHLF